MAYVNEGIALRKSGIKLPVLVLHPQADDFDDIIEYNLEPNIYSFRILNAFIKRSKSHPFHLKFNTGLNRLGFSINDIDGLCKILKGQANIKYLFSHLGASEDKKEKNYTLKQIHLFEKISSEMERKFEKSFKKHLLNTSGILNYSDFKYDMVRTGIGLYGYGNDKIFSKYLKLQYLESSKKNFAEMQKNIDSETLRFSELVISYTMFLNEFIFGSSRYKMYLSFTTASTRLS